MTLEPIGYLKGTSSKDFEFPVYNTARASFVATQIIKDEETNEGKGVAVLLVDFISAACPNIDWADPMFTEITINDIVEMINDIFMKKANPTQDGEDS